jgi:hypothetical protein
LQRSGSLAESKGFEPLVAFTTPDFESSRSIEEDPDADDHEVKPDPTRNGTRPDATVMGQSWGDSDGLEEALANALDAASAAGRFDVVAQLAGEIEARRRARGVAS